MYKLQIEVVNKLEIIGFTRKYYIPIILNAQSLLQNVRFNSAVQWYFVKYLLAISDSTIFFSVNLNIVLRYCYAKLNLMEMKQDCEDRLLMEFVV